MKGKMILNYSLATVLSLGTMSLSSCKRDKEPVLQAFQNINLHIASFSISKEIKVENPDGQKTTKLDPTISSAFFSIDNSKGEGVISNMKALPFGTELKDIRLSIKPALDSAKIELSFDGGKSFKEWKEKDNELFNLKPSPEEVKIKISLDKGFNKEPYIYTYNLMVKVHKFDPETIHWSELSSLQENILPQGVQADVYKLNDKLMVMTINATEQKNKFYELKPEAKTLEEVVMPPLPNKTYIKHLEHYEDKLYALASDGELYLLKKDDKAWQTMGQKAEAILGVFAPRTADTEASLALLVKEGTETYFAHYDKKLEKGANVPQDFPREAYRSFSTDKKMVGPELTLLTKNGVGYQTTNANSWVKINEAINDSKQNDSYVAYAQNAGIFYRFEANQEGLSIYSKNTDLAPWSKNSEVALEPAEGASFDAKSFANTAILLWVKGKDFYLYQAGTNPKLYKGILQKDVI